MRCDAIPLFGMLALLIGRVPAFCLEAQQFENPKDVADS